MKHLFTLVSCVFVLASFAQPVITKNPQSATMCIDSCHQLYVNATGSNLSFQWQIDEGSGFSDVMNETNDTITVCDASGVAPSSTTYQCIVTDGNGNSVTSNSATITLDSCLAPIADFTFTFEQANVCFTNTSQYATTILWNFGDGTTNNDNNQTPCNDYGTAWYYDVTLYAYNDYGSDEKTMTIDLVGVEELSESFNVYPNPMADKLYISSSEHFDEISILDLNGRVILTSTARSQSEIIDVQHLETGVYTLVISSDDKLMYHKLVKQ